MTVIYVDVLVSLNLFVNYFLLLSVCKINRIPLKKWRNLLSGLVLAFSSLIIFLPAMSWFMEMLVRFMVAGIGVLIAFGFGGIRAFIRNVGSLFVASFVYAGIMIGCWYAFKPKGLVLHNGIVYYNISPVALAVLTVVCYGLLTIFRKNFRKESSFEPYATLHFSHGNRNVSLLAKVDTGFSLQDIYDPYPVVLVTAKTAKELFGKDREYYRLLPYQTVNGSGLFPSAVIGPVCVAYGKNTATADKVTVAIGDREFNQEFKALIGYDFIERMDWHNESSQRIMESADVAIEKRTNRLHQRTGHLASTFKKRKRTGTHGAVEKRG